MSIAVLFVHYQWPPLSYLAGIPLALVSLPLALIDAIIRIRGGQGKNRLARYLLWIGNTGCVLALIAWVFLGDVYLR